ncbi:MAG: hypothetical protein H6969_10650 [Gammaproteobacteria bacterium]|nr:hypothetical protein [Gammaproteobacteria bacterium]
MKALAVVWGVVALCIVLVKLFTYEFYLHDDPTTGIALRSTPDVTSRQILAQTPSGPDIILVQDENAFVGTGLYRALVGWGWIVLLILWPLLLGMAYSTSRVRRERGIGDG